MYHGTIDTRIHNGGSVLGPLLFTMFVNEIPSIVSSPVLMFADDTKIFCVIRNKDDYIMLQNDFYLFLLMLYSTSAEGL